MFINLSKKIFLVVVNEPNATMLNEFWVGIIVVVLQGLAASTMAPGEFDGKLIMKFAKIYSCFLTIIFTLPGATVRYVYDKPVIWATE